MTSEASMSMNPPVLAPGVGSSYRHGWTRLWKYFLELFLIGIINLIISSVVSAPSTIGFFFSFQAGDIFSPARQPFNVLDSLDIVLGILIAAPLSYGVSFAYLKAARGDKLEIGDMFQGFRNYKNAVLANLLVTVIVIVGFILLIIPGVVFALKLSFTPYLVTDRKMEVMEAVKESWRMTNGHAWQIFFIGLLAIPIFILGLLALVVGVIPAVMWATLAGASLYYAVSQTRGQTPPLAATQTV